MIDIVFDFSSSPTGGVLPRLRAYANHFAHSPLRTHFVLDARSNVVDEIGALVKISVVNKPRLRQVLVDDAHLKALPNKPKWLFSYGIPMRGNLAERQWLHLSNALPFFYREVTIGPRLRLRSSLQQLQFRVLARNVDILSGESEFTLNCYRAATGWTGHQKVLHNGTPNYPIREANKRPFALTVGTHSYKRLDRAYAVFSEIKHTMGLDKLLILGKRTTIPPDVLAQPDVENHEWLETNDLDRMFRAAQIYLSTSEVENSSLAVLEGLMLTGKVILSDIPSHREMLELPQVSWITINKKRYLIASKTAASEHLPNWNTEIEKMLTTMGLA